MPTRIKTDYPVLVRRRGPVPLERGENNLSNISLRRIALTFAVILSIGVPTWLYYTRDEYPSGPPLNFDYSWKSEDTVQKTLINAAVPRRKPLPFCPGIFNKDPNILREAKAYMDANPRLAISNERYYDALDDCTVFLKTRGYIMQALSEEEENFPLAYDIVMYKDVEQVERLLRTIYMPQNYYCIHIDLKAPAFIHKVMRKLTGCFPNVFIATKLERVTWGTMSVLQSDLNCMKDLLKYKKWKYFINLTGQEMPLKSNREIVQILKTYDGANEVEGYRDKAFDFRTKWVHFNVTPTKKLKTRPPHHFVMTHGAIHAILSRAFVDYAINDQKAIDLQKWLKDTLIPDENFFSTLNSSPENDVPGAYKGQPTNDPSKRPFLLRYKQWFTQGEKCYGYWQRHICIFSTRDLHKFLDRKEFFVNKFEMNYEYLAYDCMEELIHNKTILSTRKGAHYDLSFYEKLDHVKNHVRL